MRVAMYYNNHDVRLEEMPVPRIGPGELLLRVDASGLCGSDVMEWYRVERAPMVLGHEVAGAVAEVGEGGHKVQRGGQVGGDPPRAVQCVSFLLERTAHGLRHITPDQLRPRRSG